MTLPKPRRKRERVERIQVYLTRSVESPDRLLLDVWNACQSYDRPQAVFRDILIKGLRGMAEEGTLPPHVAKHVPAIAALIRPDHARAVRSVASAAREDLAPAPERPPEPSPAPPAHSTERAAPAAAVPRKPEEESTAGLMGLMGRRRARAPAEDAKGETVS